MIKREYFSPIHYADYNRTCRRSFYIDSTDGGILVLAHRQSENLEALHRLNIPFVIADHRGELGPDIPSVGSTNVLGGRLATEYLLSLGHRRIAIISGIQTVRASQERSPLASELPRLIYERRKR